MIKGLSGKLKELRKMNNLSQKEVATKLGISPFIVSRYETGERTPGAENLLALSYLYKCSTDYLLGKTAEEPSVSLDTSKLTAEQIHIIQSLIRVMEEK